MKHIDGRLRGWRKGSEKSPRSAQDRVTSRTETRTSSPMVGAGRFGSRRRRRAAGNVGFLPGTGVWRRNHWDMVSV